MTPTPSRAAIITHGLAAAVALAALVIGVPAFLAATVGWPLPAGLPTANDIADAISGQTPIPDTVWLGALACLGWVMWARVTIAVVAETAAAVHGRPRNPSAGLQRSVGHLVAAVVVVITTSLHRLPTADATPPRPVALPAVVVGPDTTAGRVQRQAARPERASDTPSWTVARGDTLWAIAERTLGDPFRWSDIFELNQGRSQPDGAALVDPGLLQPGWTLRLPADATITQATAGNTVAVEAGDSLSSITQAALGDADRYPEVFALNEHVTQPDGRQLQDPNLIRPGWVLELPVAATSPAAPPAAPSPSPLPATLPPTAAAPVPPPPGPTDPTVASSPTANTNGSTNATSAIGHPDSTVGAERHRFDAGPLGAAGAVLAAGLAAVIGRRWALQRIRRLARHRAPPPPPATQAVHRELCLAAPDIPARIAAAIRLLADQLADRDPPPTPCLVQVHDDVIEILLREPDPAAPQGWEGTAAGHIWRRPLTDTSAAGSDRPSPLPALVTLGALDDGGVLIDLEAIGHLGITGEPDTVAALTASIVIELSTTPLAELHTIATIALDVASPGHDIDRYPTIRDALDELTAGIEATAAAIDDSGASTAFGLRCRSVDEAWPPAILIIDAAAITAEPDAYHQLVALAGEGSRGLAIIGVGAAPPGCTELTVTDNELAIPALGLRCAPQLLTPSAVEELEQLLDAADPDDSPVALDDDEQLTLFAPHPGEDLEPADDLEDFEDADDGPTVRVLGPIAVDGVEGLTPQQTAIVAFLTVNPNATSDALQDAIWAGRRPGKDRFLNTMHELRRTLGTERLPPCTDGRYELHGTSSDLVCFERHLQHVGDAGGPVAHLRAALHAVTGPPITYQSRDRRHYTWVDLGNHASRLEAVVADAAHHLATAALADGDTALAVWAAQRGLLACPCSETLTRDLMAAHLAAGDRRTAQSVLSEYERALDELGVSDAPIELHELLETGAAS